MVRGVASHGNRDGGYHAIKGFAFQFDASLIHALNNPGASVEVEGVQDIGVQNCHIQVKYRSSRYSPSKIASAVQQMVAQFAADPGSRFSLYCHFADRPPGSTLTLTREDLECALGQDAPKYDEDIKAWFAKSFQIHFGPDYEAQYRAVLGRLKSVLQAKNDSEAMHWHAVIHGHLRNVILTQPPGARWISVQQLRILVDDARSAVFEASYAQMCGHEKYLKLMREQYKSTSVNLRGRHRLFVVECGTGTHAQDLVAITARLQERYFLGDSHPPYVSFRGLGNPVALKRALHEARLLFNDGFGFQGSDFSVDYLVSPPLHGYGIKLVDFSRIPEVAVQAGFHEVHDFYLTEPIPDPAPLAKTRHVFVRDATDIQTILPSITRRRA